jgi:DNA-binding MarR family transcriptional regulator
MSRWPDSLPGCGTRGRASFLRICPPTGIRHAARDLLAAARRDRLSIKWTCLATNVPKTTALRTVQALCDEGLLAKAPHPQDFRSSHIELTAAGLQSIKRLLDRADA